MLIIPLIWIIYIIRYTVVAPYHASAGKENLTEFEWIEPKGTIKKVIHLQQIDIIVYDIILHPQPIV